MPSKTKARTFQSYLNYDPTLNKGEVIEGESKTVPNQSVKLKHILERHGVTPKNQVSEDFLTNDSEMKAILQKANAEIADLTRMDKVQRAIAVDRVKEHISDLAKATNEMYKTAQAEAQDLKDQQMSRAEKVQKEISELPPVKEDGQ